MLKTIPKSEFVFLQKILEKYYYHLEKHPGSLLAKIFGMHKIKINLNNTKEKKIYFVVMSSIFSDPSNIQIKYDLKGSLYKRTCTSKDNSIPKKDLDFL
jgi:1-phosphatidylinositol-4-phosphate 5-kinase